MAKSYHGEHPERSANDEIGAPATRTEFPDTSCCQRSRRSLCFVVCPLEAQTCSVLQNARTSALLPDADNVTKSKRFSLRVCEAAFFNDFGDGAVGGNNHIFDHSARL